MAEVVKTAAFRDEKEFEFMEDSADAIMAALDAPKDGKARFAGIAPIVKRIVHGSVKVKAAVVSADEREGGLRNLLNFGHSIGHAIEMQSIYLAPFSTQVSSSNTSDGNNAQIHGSFSSDSSEIDLQLKLPAVARQL